MRISDWISVVCSSDLLMGLFGIVALVVNVVAALALIPHRTGDANVRAVWLFSRNDAIGNAAVVVAAGVVAWTASSEERRVGNGCVCTCRSWGSPYHLKTQIRTTMHELPIIVRI